MNTTIIRDTPHNTMNASNQFARGAIIAGKKSERWNLHDETLDAPLRWRSPRHITNVIDLFHRDVPFEFIDRVFAVMALCPQHTFQILTKRPDRMAEYLSYKRDIGFYMTECYEQRLDDWSVRRPIQDQSGWPAKGWEYCSALHNWPLPNVWLGTSCEDQAAADARIPHLLRCPAAVRFISAEPLLGAIDFSRYFEEERLRSGNGIDWHGAGLVDWVIVGGESGKGARPCNVEWIRSIVRQCQAAGVACFVKQLGKVAYDGEVEFCRFTSYEQWVNKASSWLGGVNSAGQRYAPSANAVCLDRQGRICRIGADFMRARDEDAFSVHCHEVMKLSDPKGGDPAEWPEDLRVREWPAQKVGAAS